MNRIKELRNQAGLTQEQLADQLAVKQNTLSYWELGKTEPSSEALLRMSKIFNRSINFILGNDSITANDEALELLDTLHKRPELKALFEVSSKATPEDIRKTMAIMKALEGKDDGS